MLPLCSVIIVTSRSPTPPFSGPTFSAGTKVWCRVESPGGPSETAEGGALTGAQWVGGTHITRAALTASPPVEGGMIPAPTMGDPNGLGGFPTMCVGRRSWQSHGQAPVLALPLSVAVSASPSESQRLSLRVGQLDRVNLKGPSPQPSVNLLFSDSDPE